MQAYTLYAYCTLTNGGTRTNGNYQETGKRQPSRRIVIRQGASQKSFRKSFTAPRRSEVKASADELEPELRAPGGIERYQERASRTSPTVGDLIRRYINENDRPYGPTKADYLQRLQTLCFANRIAEDLTSTDWIEFARSLKVSRHKSTVAGYFGTLAEIMRRARRGWNVPIDIGAIEDARFMANDMGYTGKSDRRERRPSLEELNTLMDFSVTYWENDRRAVPLHFVIAFAIFSARREAEICKLRKDDVSGAMVYVRDLKNPAGSRGNHRRLWILPQALRFARAHSRLHGEESVRVFPYHPDTISRRFTEAVQACSIRDLHFHDLRHEALSRLGETGHDARTVMKVSGHNSSQQVDRYTHMEAPGDKFEDWPWLDVLDDLAESTGTE